MTGEQSASEENYVNIQVALIHTGNGQALLFILLDVTVCPALFTSD